MLLDPKKKMASVILSKLRPDGGSDLSDGPETEVDASIGKETAMKKFMDAIHAKDAALGVSALTDFMDMHEDESGDSDEESGEMPPMPSGF